MGMASKALVIFICTYQELSLFVSNHQVMPIVFAIISQTVQLSNRKILLPSHRISEDFSFEHDVIVLIPFKKKQEAKADIEKGLVHSEENMGACGHTS